MKLGASSACALCTCRFFGLPKAALTRSIWIDTYKSRPKIYCPVRLKRDDPPVV